jgi:hypothetical protein
VQHDIKHQLDRLQILLEDWANWQKGYSGARGYSDHAVGLQADRRVSGDSWDDVIEQVDNWVSQMVDAAVDDLPPGQGAAINKRYGVAAVFRFPRGNYEELLAEAHATLMQTLPKKGVVI